MLIAKHMPKGPKGQKRPADVIGNAVHVMTIATGEIDEETTTHGKDPAAVALGRKGGLARAKNVGKSKRSAIAKNAAKARWARRDR
jgi:2-keto-3-deoxy-6-phosphogluconate aldolase